MKMRLVTLCMLAAVLNAAADLSVTATNGVESLTLTFDAATGTLNLSNLALALGDATALDETKIYTIATATEVTGRFASEVLPKKWKVNVFPNKVSIAYANGTYMLIR